MSRPTKKVEKLLLDGTSTGVVYNSVKDAAADMDVAPAHISAHVTIGRPKDVGGYCFRYLDEEVKNQLVIEENPKPIDDEKEVDPDFSDVFLTQIQKRLKSIKRK